MTVRLRGHHLLCLLTYAGKGYTPAFTAEFNQIAARIAGGESVLIVDGPDDICAALLDDPQTHCHNASVVARDAASVRDVGALLRGQTVREGDTLSLDSTTIARMRRAFRAGQIRSACAGCDWAGLCSEIAGGDYAGTVIPA